MPRGHGRLVGCWCHRAPRGTDRDPRWRPSLVDPAIRCNIDGLSARRTLARRRTTDERPLTRPPVPSGLMRALVKTSPAPGLELTDVPEPSMTINDVRIRV